MYLPMMRRVILETDKRLLWKFAYNFGWRGMRSVQRFKAGLKRGEYFPPFLYISVLNSCNLRCQGCWVDVAAKQEKIEADHLHRLIREASEGGNSFFGFLGRDLEALAILFRLPLTTWYVLGSGAAFVCPYRRSIPAGGLLCDGVLEHQLLPWRHEFHMLFVLQQWKLNGVWLYELLDLIHAHMFAQVNKSSRSAT